MPSVMIFLLTHAWLIALIVPSGTANAQALEMEREVLDTIGNFAERMCPKVPLEGSSSTVELSGNAKAELNGLLKKMAALGIQGAAKYQESQFQGLVQKDLLAAIRDTTDCKLKVANSLMGKLLAASAVASPRLSVSVREELSRFVIEGNNLRGQWERRLNQPEEVQRQSAAEIFAWHKRVEDYVGKPPLGVMYLARFKNQKRGSGSYPSGINLNVAGAWDLLHSDLEKLDEFIRER
jgi:hypothetical protein